MAAGRERPTGTEIGRRTFLRKGAAAGAGLGLLPGLPGLAAELATDPLPSNAQTDGPRVRRYVRLGRTELRVSDIGFGASRLRDDPSLVRHAFESGINYFDTAEGYGGGASERVIGKALAGHRDEVVIVSKVKAGAKDRADEIMRRLEASLVRLGMDHVDIYLNHAVNDVARMQNEEWARFATRAKEQGKIRFSGMSGHAGYLTECLEWSLEEDLLDVVLVAYNFGQDPKFMQRFSATFDFVARQPGLPAFLEKAKHKDVGIVAMKTLLGARLNDMRPYEVGETTFAQAAFRWVLSSPKVHALVVSMKSHELIDEYLGASGATQSARGDALLLGRYLAAQHDQQCRYGCGDCASACPYGVSISDVLRTRMYAVDYGEPTAARDEYAALGRAAAACASCSGAPCASACPHGLDIRSLAVDAHARLA